MTHRKNNQWDLFSEGNMWSQFRLRKCDKFKELWFFTKSQFFCHAVIVKPSRGDKALEIFMNFDDIAMQ